MGRPRKKQHEYYEAKEGFFAGDLGIGIAAGQIVDAKDPVLKRREDLFRPWPGPRVYEGQNGDDEPEVEQATAAPGEKRNK